MGLVVHRSTDVLEQDPFFATLISGIERRIDPQGYALVLQISADSDSILPRYRRLAAGRRVDGVFLDELVENDPRVALVRELGLPAVAINPDAHFPLPAVRQDCATGIEEAVRHLRDLDHTTIDFLAGPPQFVHSRQRMAAWRRACGLAGIRAGTVHRGWFTYEGGSDAAAHAVRSRQVPTAILCANDLSAMGFMARIQDEGYHVPGHVSVVGYDGVKMGLLSRPSLTTVITDPADVGYHAAGMLLSIVDGSDAADYDVSPARLAVRASTGPLTL